MLDYEFTAPQGWVCPKCGRVYSPTTFMCYYCGGEEKTTVSTGTSNSATISTLNFTLCKDCVYGGTNSINCPKAHSTVSYGCYNGIPARKTEP